MKNQATIAFVQNSYAIYCTTSAISKFSIYFWVDCENFLWCSHISHCIIKISPAKVHFSYQNLKILFQSGSMPPQNSLNKN